MQDVKLLESPFLQAQRTDYITSWPWARPPARPFLREAGLTPKAPSYTNWENTGLDGHIGGHYISALSMMYAATGDTAIYNRLNYMLNELHRAQQAVGTGFIGGTPEACNFGKKLKREYPCRRVSTSMANGYPYTIYTRLGAGLRRRYLYAESDLARQMLVALTDWMIDITAGLTDQQMQDMFRSEHGGLNETFADVAEIHRVTKKCTELARRFSHKVILDPLGGKDEEPPDRHACQHTDTEGYRLQTYRRPCTRPELGSRRPLLLEHSGKSSFRLHWSTVHANIFHPANNFTSMLNDARSGDL